MTWYNQWKERWAYDQKAWLWYQLDHLLVLLLCTYHLTFLSLSFFISTMRNVYTWYAYLNEVTHYISMELVSI